MRYYPHPDDPYAQPGDTLPPERDGEQTAHYTVTEAIAWEWRRRAAGGVVCRPEEHAAAYATVTLAVLYRAGWIDPDALSEAERDDIAAFLASRLPPLPGGTLPETGHNPDNPESGAEHVD